MRIIICLLTIAFLASSCSQKFSLQKRKYNKGFYFASTKSNDERKSSDNVEKSKKSLQNHIDESAEQVNISKAFASADDSKEFIDIKKTEVFSYGDKTNVNAAVSQEREASTFSQKQFKTKNKLMNKVKQIKKGPLFDFLYNVQVGYMVVSFVIGLIFIGALLLLYYPLPIAIGIMIAIVLVMILLAGIGKTVTG